GDELGDDVHFLVRTHYLDAIRLSPRNASFATDVSRHHDVTELLLLSEGLVAALRDVDASRATYAEPYAAFRDRFCEYETGRAAEHVVKEFFGPLAGG